MEIVVECELQGARVEAPDPEKKSKSNVERASWASASTRRMISRFSVPDWIEIMISPKCTPTCPSGVVINIKKNLKYISDQNDLKLDKKRKIYQQFFSLLFRSARTSYRASVRPVHPSRPVRANFSWAHRWAETLPSGLRDPSNRIFSESPWCQLSKFGRKLKYRDKYKDRHK